MSEKHDKPLSPGQLEEASGGLRLNNDLPRSGDPDAPMSDLDDGGSRALGSHQLKGVSGSGIPVVPRGNGGNASDEIDPTLSRDSRFEEPAG